MISDELTIVGRPIDTRAFNALVFNNLIPNYSNIVEAMVIRGGGPLSFAEL